MVIKSTDLRRWIEKPSMAEEVLVQES